MGLVLVWLRRSLWDAVPRDHRDPLPRLRRRQWTTAAFALVGAVVLGLTLRIEPGNPWFYPATLGLAAVWIVGAFASGTLHLGRIATPRGLDRISDLQKLDAILASRGYSEEAIDAVFHGNWLRFFRENLPA